MFMLNKESYLTDSVRNLVIGAKVQFVLYVRVQLTSYKRYIILQAVLLTNWYWKNPKVTAARTKVHHMTVPSYLPACLPKLYPHTSHTHNPIDLFWLRLRLRLRLDLMHRLRGVLNYEIFSILQKFYPYLRQIFSLGPYSQTA